MRIRYGDAPSFLDVSSVISAYAFQGQVAAGGQVSSDLTNAIPRSIFTFGGNATYLDRPTITYTPLAGDRFAKSLLRPIPPSAIFELVQAGYSADRVLQLTVRAINGVYNRSSIGGRVRDADPSFYRLLDALRRLQLSGAVSLRLESRGGEETGTLIFSEQRSPEVEDDLQYVAKTLGIRLEKNRELTIAFGAVPRSEREIAVLSRSMIEILLEIAAGIDVPSAHVSVGRTGPAGRSADAQNPYDRPLIVIRSSDNPPPDPFAAINYRHAWYWIADDDLASKRVFTFLMLFFSRRNRRQAAGAGANHSRELSLSAFPLRLMSHSQGGWKRLVEVVDVEDDVALRRGEAPEVREMAIPAGLDSEPGDGRDGEIGGHDAGGPAVEGERRLQHAAVANWDEFRHAALVACAKDFDGIGAPGSTLPTAVLCARNGVAQGFAGGHPVRERNGRSGHGQGPRGLWGV